jgi:hypothetical protein
MGEEREKRGKGRGSEGSFQVDGHPNGSLRFYRDEK